MMVMVMMNSSIKRNQLVIVYHPICICLLDYLLDWL